VGAGFGSFLAGTLGLGPKERRILLMAGMGAGIAAIFRAPLAGAIFAAEVLYRSTDFEGDVLVPAALASVVSYSTFAGFFGWEPLFAGLAPITFRDPWELGPYLVLALVMALLAEGYVRSFYGITAFFHRLAIPRHVKPAIGGLLTGLLGLALYYSLGENPQGLGVLSTGYGILQQAMTGQATSVVVLLSVALVRIVTTGLTIGSGGSAGVFGSSMVIGGCAGGALGLLFHQWWPDLVPSPAAFAVVGMAGFFAAAAKTPLSTLLMVSEITGHFSLLLPALWVCTLSYLFSGEESIYCKQVENREHSPAHQHVAGPGEPP
jgi:CIC family chloride channel protein